MSAVTSSELPGREGTDLSLDVQGLALRVDGFWGLGFSATGLQDNGSETPMLATS